MFPSRTASELRKLDDLTVCFLERFGGFPFEQRGQTILTFTVLVVTASIDSGDRPAVLRADVVAPNSTPHDSQ